MLLLKDEVFAIVGAAIEVHRELKSGFLEAVYQEALEIEMDLRGIPYEPQKPLRLQYKGRQLEKEYCADMVCYGQIIVELKAITHTSGAEQSQVINYLRATGLRVGVMLNFGLPTLDWKRFVC